MPDKQALTVEALKSEARSFSIQETGHREPVLFGVTDGKAVGTYLEQKFRSALASKFRFEAGSSARGVDFPDINVDMKVTSIRQPQSSCPFKSARQKIYGLGYDLIVFIYDKSDDHSSRTARLEIVHCIYVEKSVTADFQITSGINQILSNEGNQDDIAAFLLEKFLPVDEIQAADLASEIIRNPPVTGYLTISNALQWRLQYKRVIDRADDAGGLERIV